VTYLHDDRKQNAIIFVLFFTNSAAVRRHTEKLRHGYLRICIYLNACKIQNNI